MKTQHLLRNFTTNSKSQTASSNKQKNTKSTHSNNQDIIKIANRIKRKYSAKYAIHTKRSTIRKQRKPCAAAIEKRKTVELFFERDDVSRLTTGKKDTITRKKVKKQKRFLLESLGILHSKFLSEDSIKISYSRFCEFRPFWVRIPTIKDRETCLCKIHENTKLQVEKCKQLNIIQNTNLPTLIGQIACSVQSKKCMYGECTECKATRIETNSYDRNEETWWWTWRTKEEERNIKKKDERETIKVKMTCKEKVHGCAYDLVTTLEDSLVKMKKHHFNINHQYQAYRCIRENMGIDEAMVHIDFAENYVGKHADEPQGAHFGASKSQTTLHTGVLYLKDKAPFSFCTISPSLMHGPRAIWAYMEPVFEYLEDNHPEVMILHIFSDGPVTQYRQKHNFCLFSKRLIPRFKMATWNFFESSHGKGAPDGIGAALKRIADNLVSHKNDVPDAFTFYELVKPMTPVKLFLVTEEDIAKQPALGDSVPTVPGIYVHHSLSLST